MQMQMKDRLAGAGAIIQDRAIAREDLAFTRELRGHQLQLAEYGLILGRGFGQRYKMFAWTNQDVRRRLRADILKREKVGILIHDLRRNLFRGNLAEQTVGAHRVPPEGVPSSNRVTNGVKPSRWRS